MKKPEWEKYKVGSISKRRNWAEPSCQPFSTVRHIAHIHDAVRIIEDGMIRSSLVWDESRLKNSRTCVSWVSPNSWAYGSIYGNVSFEFDWETIINDGCLYWVEDVGSYKPPAYRILVTDKDYDSDESVVPYDETKPEGPLYWDGKTWYRNGYYTGEIMVDSDLSLRNCRKIEFVDHHPRYCAKSGSSCPELGLSQYKAGPRIMANLIGRGLRRHRKLFLKKQNDEFELTPNTASIFSKLIQDFVDEFEDTDAVVTGKNRISLLKAALVLYGEEDYDDAFSLSKLLGSKSAVKKSFRSILSKFFRLPPEQIDNEFMPRRRSRNANDLLVV